MELKKNPKADLTKKSGLFFSIGLLVALSSVITAFEWGQEKSIVDITCKMKNTFEPTLDILPTSIVPPPPVVAKRIVLVETQDDPEIETIVPDIEIETDVPEIFVIPAPEVEEPEDNNIFIIVEESASPKNGRAAFYQYVADNFKYPAQARRMGIEGKVFVEFVINKDGTISDVKVIKGIGAGCDEEAVRVVQSSPNWNPGKQRGKPVRQRYTLPIIFKLG